MSIEGLPLLLAGVFLIAVLYSSVGHAGASGYIAILSLLGMLPAVIRPTALALNVLVASIASVQFVRAGHFSWRLFWPFAALSVPFAFLGGYVHLPMHVFKGLLGVILLYSAVRFVVTAASTKPATTPPLLAALASGALIGLLSGLTGTGGGIFLTPLLLFLSWAEARPAAAVSAVFILLNSLAGLLGNLSSTRQLPPGVAPMLVTAAIGALVGSHLGSRRLAPTAIRRLLAAVLLIAGLKLLLT